MILRGGVGRAVYFSPCQTDQTEIARIRPRSYHNILPDIYKYYEGRAKGTRSETVQGD